VVAIGDRVDQYRALARQALADLLDQRRPFGRLALVQVFMLAGETLVTISLAGSLFFSISPDEAKSKVFLYLVLTLAPFAVISPLLGPLIDRNRGARRATAVFAAAGSCVIVPFMAMDIHSLLLFPEAFLILVLSNLYLVTRNALVPEIAGGGAVRHSTGGKHGRRRPPPDIPTSHGEAIGFPFQPGQPAPGEADSPTGEGGESRNQPASTEFAVLNARLTLLGTLAGFVAAIPGVLLLKLTGATGVLVFDIFVFAAAVVAGLRLPVHGSRRRSTPRGASTRSRRPPGATSVRRGREATEPPSSARAAGSTGAEWETAEDPDLVRLQPIAHPEVLFGLTTVSLMRGLSGFLVFLVAFGLRREHAALWWYGLVLGASGLGSLVGLLVISRLRRYLSEQELLLGSIWLIAVAAIGAAVWGTIPAQAALALCVGFAGSLAQPSFAAVAQRYVPLQAQGRAFARFATRQQLVWVLGAIIPVVVPLAFPAGDVVMAAVAGAGGLFYVTSRRALRQRALPRRHAPPS
jgi:Na+/melibiose symporter-like transporter